MDELDEFVHHRRCGCRAFRARALHELHHEDLEQNNVRRTVTRVSSAIKAISTRY